MQIFSKRFQKRIYITCYLFDIFLEEVRYTKYFNEDVANDLLYFAFTLYNQKNSLLKQRMNQVVFLREIAKLLNDIEGDKLITLKEYELLEILNAEDKCKALKRLKKYYY
ncbi:MAG: hypothetical protein Q4D02_07060 [Clostridia bacterium]|nr:hypothetical protein [Clostridia bacterium]